MAETMLIRNVRTPREPGHTKSISAMQRPPGLQVPSSHVQPRNLSQDSCVEALKTTGNRQNHPAKRPASQTPNMPHRPRGHPLHKANAATPESPLAKRRMPGRNASLSLRFTARKRIIENTRLTRKVKTYHIQHEPICRTHH